MKARASAAVGMRPTRSRDSRRRNSASSATGAGVTSFAVQKASRCRSILRTRSSRAASGETAAGGRALFLGEADAGQEEGGE